ncbi:cytochrome P450 family protein [Nocardiopsis coralliicola]
MTDPTDDRVRTAGGCPLRDGAVPLHDLQESGVAGAELWERMREQFGAVAPVWIDPGIRGWLLLGYEENLAVMRDWSTYSRDTRRWREIREGRRSTEGLRPSMAYRANALYADGAEHTRLAAPIRASLGRVTEERLRADIVDVADRLIDAFCARGSADLVAEFAMPLPALLVNRLFGLEDAYGHVLGDISAGIWSNDAASAVECAAQLRSYFGGLVQRKRAAPGDDVTSWMMDPAHGMTDTETVDQLILIVSAGHLPTGNLLGNVLRALLAEPETAAAFGSGGLPLEEVVNHVIWTEPPMQALAARFPTRDVVIGGTPVGEGEPLVIGFGPAHADPRLRHGRGTATASALPTGRNSAHLMWGVGEHRCPARALAEQLVAVGVERALERLPGLQCAVPLAELRWTPTVFGHGLSALPVEFTPSAAPDRTPVPKPRPAAAAAGRGADRDDDLLSRLLRWWQGSGRRRAGLD